ncbi:MAG: RHS repeat-associated core domain-containing protein, partial [Candidatus Marinimicrobia bacterium]|nr:RHS repeat-associated core domain-containing protein [Candidatus Neomarinimicrobiota bacterium]
MKVDKTGITRYITSSGKVLSEYDGDDNLKYNYIYGNGKKLARKNSAGVVTYIHNDPESLTLSGQVYLGSARAISNASGTMDWSRDFYSFGEENNASGTSNAYKFTGKVGVPMKSGRRSRLSGKWEEESDLYYSWHRYYDPEIGRFTQVDPLWMEYPHLSSYQYCDNNPLKFVDQNGSWYIEVNFNPDRKVPGTLTLYSNNGTAIATFDARGQGGFKKDGTSKEQLERNGDTPTGKFDIEGGRIDSSNPAWFYTTESEDKMGPNPRLKIGEGLS